MNIFRDWSFFVPLKLEAVKFLNMMRRALSDTLSFCFDIGFSSPAFEMSKYVEADFAFMSVFCLHILTVRKSFANLVVCKPTQAYDWFPLAHLLQKGRSHRPLIKHRLIEKSKLLEYGCVSQ